MGSDSWRGEQGRTECAIISFLFPAFHIPRPGTIPLLYSLTSQLTQEEHICYITASKLELALRQGESSFRPCPSESKVFSTVSRPVVITKTTAVPAKDWRYSCLPGRCLEVALLLVLLPLQQCSPTAETF